MLFKHFFREGGLEFIGAFLAALGYSFLATYGVRKLAFHFDFIDRPDAGRKRHLHPVALLGGVALFISFWLVVGFFVAVHPALVFGKVTPEQLGSVFLATFLLLILGIADEKYDLSPRKRFVATLAIAAIPILGGIGLDGITNPWGGTIGLDRPELTIPFLNTVLVLGDILVFFWLLGMMYTTKLLDGLDGLATGVTAIGSVMIFLLTRTPKFFQPDVGLLAIIFAGACLGFLVFNFKPASIFLGESGSLFLGFILGILAVISGGKIATTLLVMAVPVLDVLRVMVVRMLRGQKVSQGDREHLHYRLLEFGLSERTVVVVLYTVAFLFGISTLLLQSTGKIVALAVLFLAMILMSIIFYRRSSSAV